MQSPRAWGVPHDNFREHQFDTIQWIINNPNKLLIIEAPVGSGKSAVASGIGKDGISRVLTYSINLQEQYKFGYKFATVFGLRNYECELLNDIGMTKNPLMADDCMFPEGMHECPVSMDCLYMIAKDKVKKSRRQALSYAYWMRANWPKENPSKYLYLDEAHLIPDIVKASATLVFTPDDVEKMGLKMYPTITLSNQSARQRAAAKWLVEVQDFLKDEYNKLADIPKTARQLAHIRAMRRLTDKIGRLGATLTTMQYSPSDFHVAWDEEQFKLAPLTARIYFPRYFQGFADKVILTSATIGDPQVLADELGIKSFDFRSVPPTYTPEENPIYVLDSPKMNYQIGSIGKQKQARQIVGLIKDQDPSWAGLIHTSSWNQANDLKERMQKMGLGRRVWIADTAGTTSDKMKAWEHRMRKVPNTLTISPSFRQGFDPKIPLQINVVAKVPFAPLDEFGMATMKRNKRFYNLQAGVGVMQAIGRIRRGHKEDYEKAGKPRRKINVIADGNVKRVLSEFSSFFKDCMVSYE